MAQLWGGRFTKDTDRDVYLFNASIGYDKRLYSEDIKGSMVHARMLAKQGIITKDELEDIIKGLNTIMEQLEDGSLEITDEYEDIHSFVEANLTRMVGDAGKKLHTGRSRNDQVALDMKLYVRSSLKAVEGELKEFQKILVRVMEENLETYMPGFTHLQKAQPVTLAHHLGAYF